MLLWLSLQLTVNSGPSPRVRIEAKPRECQLEVGSYQWQYFSSAPTMACCKNARGGLSNEDPKPLPRLTAYEKGKAKKTTTKKRKFANM